jgi:uncharacterized membrane protein
MVDNTKGILIITGCTVLTAMGQYFLKLGLKNYLLLFFGLCFYGVSLLLLLLALRFGELSVVYPFISLSYVWVTLISIFLLGESATPGKTLGVGFILFGVVLITGGSR